MYPDATGAAPGPAAARRATRIDTGVGYDPRRVYRLVGLDLYSAASSDPLREQVFELTKEGVLSPQQAIQNWRVVIQGGKIVLET